MKKITAKGIIEKYDPDSGRFTAVIESFDKKPTIEIDEHQNIYDYTISWE